MTQKEIEELLEEMKEVYGEQTVLKALALIYENQLQKAEAKDQERSC